MPKNQPAKAQGNSSENSFTYLLAYLIGWLTGIIIYITEGQSNKRARFHAIQAILLGVIATVLWFVPVIGWVIAFVIWLYGLYLGWEGTQGRDCEAIGIGSYAKQFSS